MTLAGRILGPRTLEEVEIVRGALPRTGVMVDVGAHGGSSLGFARDGWEVWAFEPDPANRALLEQEVKTLPNVHVDPRAITPVDGDEVSFYTSDESTGISGLTAFHPTHRATSVVTTVRLDTFLKEYGVDEVTLLKTDTEGYDLPVLETFPWDLHPRAVICEFEDSKTRPLGYTYEDVGRFLLDKGYEVLLSEWYPIVRYGVRHSWRSLRRYPTRLKDDNAWGNFIAVDHDLLRRVLPLAKFTGYRLRLRYVAEKTRTRLRGV